MEAAIAPAPKPKKAPLSAQKPAPKRRFATLQAFRQWKPEDGFKYEWNDGTIEKSPKMLTFKTLYIAERLTDLFSDLKKTLPRGGQLFTEPESMTSPRQLRIPDMAYYTSEQVKLARTDENPGIPEFAIEFVSTNDQHEKVLEKLDEYFAAGMKVAWLVFPRIKMVYVYTSPIDVTICRGERVCSAETVVPGFKIVASDLFD